MFPPEDDEGNVEYKRHLCSSEIFCEDDYSIRFHQLVTQLKFRADEGKGTAIYYIGINDDGSKYNLSSKEKVKSLQVLKKMVNFLKYEIVKTFIDDDYIKAVIYNKRKDINFSEKRILLLGDTESGKTTFLAYLIKNKLDKPNCKAKLYILNHKHEIETGKTSSFNYQQIINNEEKFIFIDTPGDDFSFNKNSKTRNKIILSFNFDLILIMNKNNNDWSKRLFYINIAKFLKIPYIDLNLFDENCKVNLINPLSQSEILDFFNSFIDTDKICKVNLLNNFFLIQSFPHHDMGWIISGYLEGGELSVGDEMFWYDGDKVNVVINSIYLNNQPVDRVKGPLTLSITLEKNNMLSNKPRSGFLSRINYNKINSVKLTWIYFSNVSLIEEKDIVIFLKNQTITLKKENKSYKLITPTFSFNLLNKYFIYEKDNKFGFGKVFTTF